MQKTSLVAILVGLLVVTVGLAGDPVWRLRKPLWIIEGQSSIGGREFGKAISLRASFLGGYPLTKGVEKYLQQIRNSNNILFIDARSDLVLSQLQELEKKYPELLPLSYDELVHYPLPLIYFSRGTYTFMVRGIVVAKSDIGDNLANTSVNKDIPLDIVLQYKKGQLVDAERVKTTWEEEWRVLSDDNFTVKYKSGYENDAKSILDYAIEAKKAVETKFPYPFTKPITIYLYTKPRGPIKGYGHASVTQNPPALHFISPSVSFRRSSYYDENWYRANVAHEYTHLVQMAVLEDKQKGYSQMRNLPGWFKEGMPEYLGKYTPQIKKKYTRYREQGGKLAKYGFLAMGDVYAGGYYVAMFMFEKYSGQAVFDILRSPASSFYEALEQELNVTTLQFEQEMMIWLTEKLGI